MKFYSLRLKDSSSNSITSSLYLFFSQDASRAVTNSFFLSVLSLCVSHLLLVPLTDKATFSANEKMTRHWTLDAHKKGNEGNASTVDGWMEIFLLFLLKLRM